MNSEQIGERALMACTVSVDRKQVGLGGGTVYTLAMKSKA